MAGKSKAPDTSTHMSDDALRQRAYLLWEADGRPEGRGDHYWHLAHEEAHRMMVEDTASRTAKITKGKNPLEMPPEVKAGQKAAKSKVKVKVAEEAKAKPAKKAKPVEVKSPKKATKPRAAVMKAP
jgi:hypothetical protein